MPGVIGTTSAWAVPSSDPTTFMMKPRRPVAWDQSLCPVPGSPQNLRVRCCMILAYWWIVMWWSTVWQYWSPVLRATTGWCGTPHSESWTNWDISRNMNRWKSRIESAAFAPIQKIYLLQLSYNSTTVTPDSNRVHTHLVAPVNSQPPGLDEWDEYCNRLSVLDLQ